MNFFGYCIFFAILIIPAILLISKCVKQQQKSNDQKRTYNASVNTAFQRVDGLSIASGSAVEVLYRNEKMTFLKGKQEISVLTSKIVDIDVVDGKNLKSQVASGAIAGKYIIGGTAGDLMGAALATTMYLVITYKSDNDYRFIVFDTGLNTHHAYKIKNEFKKNNNHEIQSIEL